MSHMLERLETRMVYEAGEADTHTLHSRDVCTLHRRLVRSGFRIEAAQYFVDPCGGYVLRSGRACCS